jgi:hypothetical protein
VLLADSKVQARIQAVTTKERLHRLVDELSEREVDEAFEYIASRHESRATPGDTIDEWGDLDAHMDAAMRGALRELDETEAAQGFSWDRYR